jgi:hypothetical protein
VTITVDPLLLRSNFGDIDREDRLARRLSDSFGLEFLTRKAAATKSVTRQHACIFTIELSPEQIYVDKVSANLDKGILQIVGVKAQPLKSRQPGQARSVNKRW